MVAASAPELAPAAKTGRINVTAGTRVNEATTPPTINLRNGFGVSGKSEAEVCGKDTTLESCSDSRRFLSADIEVKHEASLSGHMAGIRPVAIH
ncbi:hypothetical protein YK56LOC_50180 [Caballeronia sp. HLA56]